MVFFIIFGTVIIVLIGAITIPRRQTKYFDGPPPTETDRKDTIRWIANHIEKYPNSSSILQNEYPDAANMAKASRRYKEIEKLRGEGLMDEIDYQRELLKILPLIDITEDIQPAK